MGRSIEGRRGPIIAVGHWSLLLLRGSDLGQYAGGCDGSHNVNIGQRPDRERLQRPAQPRDRLVSFADQIAKSEALFIQLFEASGKPLLLHVGFDESLLGGIAAADEWQGPLRSLTSPFRGLKVRRVFVTKVNRSVGL